ncbi:MAG: glycosyltransferase family 87 protein [Candidatus Bathyarchaeia archaeon]|nr:glycosyltransferase family 87 protein [Candidatus Bathyarchaeia archaeon]
MNRDTHIIIAYILIVAFLYIFFPLGFEVNWYHFFDPMRIGFIPYVDFQVGYPVLGFMPYGLLALLCPSERIYGYVMRYINLALLSISLFAIYKVVDRHRGQRDALFTLLAPILSASILIGNPYSNDVIALCFFSLALFFLMRKSPMLCGLLMGLAIFAKLYPLLLLPMFLAFFENWRERLSLLTSLVLSVLLLNFVFLVLNPYMLCETFFGNAGRGPWETIWAFLSGYYSHGGVEHTHPYFEGFFTYAQLEQIYPLTHADHAFYLYSNSAIPLVMSSLLLLSFIVPLILFTRKRILKLIGLSSSLFFLASKGYSPQFSIFTIPLLALSVPGKKKFVLTSLLDAATILQMMNWSGWFAPFGEGVFLLYAVLLRTVVLVSAFIICFNYTTSGLRMRKVIVTRVRSFLSDLAHSLHVFFASRQIVKRTVPLVALILVFSLLFYTTYGSYAGKLVGYDRELEVNTYEMNGIAVTHDLKERIYIIIPESLDVGVDASDCYIPEEEKIGNTTRVFVIPYHKGETNIYINLSYPVTNFYIDEVLINGDVKKVKGSVTLHQEDSSLTITAENPDEQKYYVLYLSWSVSFRINESTTVCATLTHLDGNLNGTVLALVDERGVFFDYELIPGDSKPGMVWEKVINASSTDAFGRYFTDFLGKNVSDMNLVMTLKPSTNATVKLDVLSYSTNGRKTQLPLTVQDSIICNATVYLGEFFNLKNPPVGIITWSIPVIAALYAHYLVRRVKVEGINNKRHN